MICQILIVNKRWFLRDFFQDFQFIKYHFNKWNIINGKERIVMNLDLSKIWKPFWISPAQKSFLLTEPGKEDVFIIFICFQTLSVKRPKIFFRACLLLKPIPVFSNYHWSKTIWYGNKIACMLCYFAQFRCCW